MPLTLFLTLFPMFGSAFFVVRFIGTDSCPIISTVIALLLLLVTLILSSFLFFVILILIYIFCTFPRYLCFSLLAGMTSACIWQSSESLATFRAEIAADNEAEIYARIRSLRGRDYYNLPPQNNPGEYEGLVHNNFEQAIDVPHYRAILDREYFELTVLERKGLLQDRLFDLMFGEQKIYRIMELSLYTNIRTEAYDFLEGKVEPVSSLQHSFQRDIMDGSLNFFIQDTNQSGRNSQIYREFYSHFNDEVFRLKFGLPLP
uniref:Uncharacterized protein n=1 Tax=Lactuca sativa TaxID=4236 RepID=A0A9R1V7L3_LACSA|nr:hypothetical protein LSAT_V11C600339050 [Lactuca sativa]